MLLNTLITVAYTPDAPKGKQAGEAKMPENFCAFSLGHFQAKRNKCKFITI